MPETEVDVFVQLAGDDVLAGRLWSHRRRTESQTFVYAPEYLERPDAYALDPALPLVAGQQQTPNGQASFGAFSDSAPDRWGRRLIARSETRRAKREGNAERSFAEIDYLLGVRDDLRQGALRFRLPGGDAFVADEVDGVPSLIELPRLIQAAEHLERDDASEEELATLLRAGSSLGGARPKAHTLDSTGRIAIAKFPSAADEWDVIRWEAMTLDLADVSGITVAPRELHEIDGKPVLVVDRFDRAGEQRIGYVSAMTMLERADREAGSYLEIAAVIEETSPQTSDHLAELWRRMAFSVLISNFDDHLRNHGFLRESTAGWSLSPAFDLNPDPRPGRRELKTMVDLDSADASIDLALSVAGEFRLVRDEALSVVCELSRQTSRWREFAAAVGLPDDEIERMEPAFEHEESLRARELARLVT